MNCPYCGESCDVKLSPQESAIAVCTRCINPIVLRPGDEELEVAKVAGWQEIEEVAREGSIGAELIQSLPDMADHLPILPEVAHRVMEMVRDPEVAIEDLAAAISQDQVIALKVLQLANSALYGGLSEIVDVEAACARLGMKNVVNTVNAVVNGRLYVSQHPTYKEMMRKLWIHALATAHCSAELAIMRAEPRSDVYFTAGLLHDVGKVLILDLVANEGQHKQTPLLANLRESPELVDEINASYHPLVGLYILQRWGLPAEFGTVAFCHGNVDALPSTDWLTLAHVVGLASALSNASGYGLDNHEPGLTSSPSAKYLALSDVRLAALRVDLEDKLQPLLEVSLTT